MPTIGFDEMTLSPSVHSAVQKAGYQTPTPIQSQTIPILLEGKDIIGQARTGTGKTAAFALPLLSRIDLSFKRPQVLVLTPTRELAIQVAESFKTYGKDMKGLNVLAVYGGQSYGVQLAQLKRGVHVIVGTPGRLMDHMKRKTISLAHLFGKVLDEADEMLRMGFIDDVEWILSHAPEDTQTALFSATMPPPIRRIAQKYLRTPEEIMVKSDKTGIETIDQKYWLVKGCHKNHGLIRILEATTFDGVIIFVNTKSSTLTVAKALEDRGLKAEALNGDIAQNARERTVNRLKNGQIDILVATDVAARGLDVDRISHVINYDMPSKIEPYVHRIGRTGRAGRQGEAILFLYPKERWMLRKLEQATGQKIDPVFLPTNKAINKKRKTDFKEAITAALESTDLDIFQELVTSYAQEQDLPLETIAAALGKMAHGDMPFLLQDTKATKSVIRSANKTTPQRAVAPRAMTKKPEFKNKTERLETRLNQATPKITGNKNKKKEVSTNSPRPMKSLPLKKGMERFRIEVGRSHGVKAGDIVGAISNEAGLESKYIKSIDINQDFSLLDLPMGMPNEVFHLLQKTWVKSQPMSISRSA